MEEYHGGWKVIGTILNAVISDPGARVSSESESYDVADLYFTDRAVLAIPQGQAEDKSRRSQRRSRVGFVLTGAFRKPSSRSESLPPSTITYGTDSLIPMQVESALDVIAYDEVKTVLVEGISKRIVKGIVERFLGRYSPGPIVAESFTRITLKMDSSARIAWTSQRLSRPFGLSSEGMRKFLGWFPLARWYFSKATWYIGLPPEEVGAFLKRTPIGLKVKVKAT